jgi:hypothetical protein
MTAHQKANKQNLQVGDLVKSNFQAIASAGQVSHKHFDSERKLGIVLEIAEEVKHNEHLGPYIECKVEWLSGPHSGAAQVMADFFLVKV